MLKTTKAKLKELQKEKKDLVATIETAQKEFEEIQSKISAIETEISSYDGMDLLNDDDSAHLEEKRERLVASRQDLLNYKLCLD